MCYFLHDFYHEYMVFRVGVNASMISITFSAAYFCRDAVSIEGNTI